MLIAKNNDQRFDINNLIDLKGQNKEGEIVKGIAGYHGPLANIIGWLLEKIFQKTVALHAQDGTFYLNCVSLSKWAKRISESYNLDAKEFQLHIHDSSWIENVLKNVKMRGANPIEVAFQKPIEEANKNPLENLPVQKQENPPQIFEKKERFRMSAPDELSKKHAQDMLECIYEDKTLNIENKDILLEFEKLANSYRNDRIQIQIIAKNNLPFSVTNEEKEGFKKTLEKGCHFFTSEFQSGWGARIDNVLAISKDVLIEWSNAQQDDKVRILKLVFDEMNEAVYELHKNDNKFPKKNPKPNGVIPQQKAEEELPIQNQYVKQEDDPYKKQPDIAEQNPQQKLEDPLNKYKGKEQPKQAPPVQVPNVLPDQTPFFNETKIDKKKDAEIPKEDPLKKDKKEPLINPEVVEPKINPENIKLMREYEILKFNFKNVDLTQEIVDTLFDTTGGNYSKAARLIPQMSVENINSLSPFFSIDHLVRLREDQIKKFEFKNIKLSQEIVDTLFKTDVIASASRIIPDTSLDNIYLLSEYFSKDHWKWLTNDQIKKFDFSQIKPNKEIVNTLFTTDGHYPTASKLIPYISLENIYLLSEYFSKDHWKWLTNDQIKKFDFSQIKPNKEIVNALFTTDGFHQTASKLIPSISLENIYLLSEHFSKDHWKWLTDDQVKKFDFSKIKPNKEIVDSLFTIDGYYPTASKLIPSISLENIYLLSEHFSTKHWRWLTDDQIKKFDFSQIEVTKEIVDTLFTTEGIYSTVYKLISSISLDNIYHLISYFSKIHWGALSKEQIRSFEFDKIIQNDKILNKDEIFMILFDTQGYPPKAGLLPELKYSELQKIDPYLKGFVREYLPKK